MSVSSYRLLLDKPSAQPALDFDRYADALAGTIEKSDPQFVIGLFGSWGSGKTTLMQEIKGRLNKDKVISVDFSAWRYEKEEHLIVPLLDTIREALVEWSGKPHVGALSARNIARRIGGITKALVAGLSFKAGLPNALELSFDANKSLAKIDKLAEDDTDALVPRSFYHASFKALNEAFEKFVGVSSGRRIVIFIDDLDRCLPEGALEVLESMKLFFDIKGFVFVVGLDDQVVERLIDAKYRRQADDSNNVDGLPVSGADYVKKIFQMPFALPPVSRQSLDDFLTSIYKEANLPEAQKKDLQKSVAPHLPYIVTESGVNPREVKRYINSYILQMKINIDRKLDPQVILAVNTITFQPEWKDVKKYLHSGRNVFLAAVKKRVLSGDRESLSDVAPGIGDLPQSFRDYVAADGPGHCLLEVGPINDYIRAGGLTSSGGQEVSEMFWRISELGRTVKPIIESYDFKGKLEVSSPKSEFLSLTSRVETVLSGSNHRRKVKDDLSAITAFLDELINSPASVNPNAEPNEEERNRIEDTRKEWLARLQQLIGEAQNHLGELLN
jgi:hypothetical protein